MATPTAPAAGKYEPLATTPPSTPPTHGEIHEHVVQGAVNGTYDRQFDTLGHLKSFTIDYDVVPDVKGQKPMHFHVTGTVSDSGTVTGSGTAREKGGPEIPFSTTAGDKAVSGLAKQILNESVRYMTPK